MSLSKEVDTTYAQRPVPCDACDDEVPGTYYCRECKKTLCGDCEKAHNKFTKGHTVVLRAQIGEVDTSILTCTDHGEDAYLHCEKCNMPVCIECVTGKHQGHKMVNLNTIIEKRKEWIQGHIDEIQNVVIPNLKTQEDKNKTDRENYNIKMQQLKKEMEDKNIETHQELDRVHHSRLKCLKDTQENYLSLFDVRDTEIRMVIDHCKGRVSEYQEAIRKNNIKKISSFVARKEILPDVYSKSVIPKLPLFDPPNIQGIVKNFGNLRISSPSLLEKPIVISEFKCPLKGFPRICITREGCVWLGGHKSKELVMVDIYGQIMNKRKINVEPCMLAVMDCGDVIIVPQEEGSLPVIRLLADGTEEHVFDPSPSDSYGIFVNADQKMLICTFDGRVLKTNEDGTDVKQIYKGNGKDSVIHAIENKDGNIYISTWKKPAILIVNKDGRVLSVISKTVSGEMLQQPLDLTQDVLGNILCVDQARNCIYIIDQENQLRELLGTGNIPKMKLPRCVAVDNEYNLWITQRDGTILVVKYLTY